MSATEIFSLNHIMRSCHCAKSWGGQVFPAEGAAKQRPQDWKELNVF